MWIPHRVKHLGRLNISQELKCLKNIEEKEWLVHAAARANLAGDRPTDSIYFHSMMPVDFINVLAKRPLTQNDVPIVHTERSLYEKFAGVIEDALKFYPDGGIIVRAQLARMSPGSKITRHYDRTEILTYCNRIHLPLVTNDKVQFVVDGELVIMKAGNVYEFNNQLYHSVVNPEDAPARTHLIIDYLSPEHNHIGLLDERYRFEVRRRQVRTSKKEPALRKEPTQSIHLPKLAVLVHYKIGCKSREAILLVDMHEGEINTLLDRKDCENVIGDFDASPFRRVCVANEVVVICSSDQIYFFSSKFESLFAINNPYLEDIADIAVDGEKLYIASRAFDAILRFDIGNREFDLGWKFSEDENGEFGCRHFNPNVPDLIVKSELLAINSVFLIDDAVCFSGRFIKVVKKLAFNVINDYLPIPLNADYVSAFNRGIVYWDVKSKRVVYSSNYNYREINLSAQIELDSESSCANCEISTISKYKRGTVFLAKNGSTISFYDFKNLNSMPLAEMDLGKEKQIQSIDLWPY